jgi:hypothetical protein
VSDGKPTLDDVITAVQVALNQVHHLNRGMISTSEHRQRRELAASQLADTVDAALPIIRSSTQNHVPFDAATVIADKHAQLSKALKERDDLQTSNEAMKATISLYEKTRQHLPIVGVVCDGPGPCSSAVGVVGIRALDSDVVADQCLAIAVESGWIVVHENGTQRQFCPRCVMNGLVAELTEETP